jgi:hypothetical protein
MPTMKPLDPAIEAELPAEGWRLLATEAGRSSAGLQASVDLWNGCVKHTKILLLACPEQWGEFKAAVALMVGCAEGHVHEALLSLKPAIEGQLRDQAAPSPKGTRQLSQASQLVELAADAELFHTPEGEAYATIEGDGHRETWLMKTKGFRRWLAQQFYRQEGKAPGSQALQDALGVLEGQALFGGPEYPVYTRLAEHDGAVYLDLANAAWEAVEITSAGWRVVTDPPLKFRRARGMLPLPCPVRGGHLDDLRGLLNIGNDRDWTLLKSWLVKTLRPSGPHPVLTLHGEQGSAKSTASRMLRALIDPNTAALRAEPRDERDLVIAATNGWIIALDNLDHVPPWPSNAICRLATGGGFGTRELYTDSEEILFDAQRPVLLNGIEELATRGDLLDRAIIVYLPAIPEDKRKPEKELWAAFSDKCPAMLGALLDAVSTGLAHVATIKLERLPRMADFAIWAVAAASELGYTEEDFLRAYAGNRSAAHELALDASLIVPPLRDLLASKNGAWQGTATELLHDLTEQANDHTRKAQGWPGNGRAASGALRRVAPNLRQIGIHITFPSGHRKGRIIKIEHLGDFASPPSSPSPDQKNHSLTEDAKGDAKSGGDAKGDANRGGDAKGDANPRAVSADKHRKEDAGDDEDAKKHIYSNQRTEETWEV